MVGTLPQSMTSGTWLGFPLLERVLRPVRELLVTTGCVHHLYGYRAELAAMILGVLVEQACSLLPSLEAYMGPSHVMKASPGRRLSDQLQLSSPWAMFVKCIVLRGTPQYGSAEVACRPPTLYHTMPGLCHWVVTLIPHLCLEFEGLVFALCLLLPECSFPVILIFFFIFLAYLVQIFHFFFCLQGFPLSFLVEFPGF